MHTDCESDLLNWVTRNKESTLSGYGLAPGKENELWKNGPKRQQRY
jgi:hypothetical protein